MKKLGLLIITMLYTTSLIAQTVTGEVIDSDKNPIPYANIYSDQRTKHTHTDDMGKFEIQRTENDTLIISHLGYEPKRVYLTNENTNLLIVLKRKSIQLKTLAVKKELSAINLFSDINVKTTPVQNAQEVLLNVPGLFIGQHAGGGKAEQLFLRGFDIDHGTDVGITVENMPVNMVSHAHGQGYADMHFIIPETIDKIDFTKGPYQAEQGNFSTAGSVNLKLKKKLTKNMIKLEGGQFNHKRVLGMINLLNKEKQQAYIATSWNTMDGPFESEQNFSRFNFMGRYNAQFDNANSLTISASHFKSKWDASGQIPERAVQSGAISRFGAIDDTEGGQTSRSNIWLKHTKLFKKGYLKTDMYYTHYDFELFSNFTFFLEDSINGDQIKQKESRKLLGTQVEYGQNLSIWNAPALIKIGIGYRNDQTENTELSHTKNRKTTLAYYQLGDIDETNLSAYTNAEIEIGNFLVQPGIRIDHFDFGYYDKLASSYNPSNQESSVFSPSLNILYNYNKKLQLYFKSGKGFHSNDSRTIALQSVKTNVPSAWGYDIGFIWKAHKNLFINLAAWQLYLEQEFVYVGDAGIVEPSGETSRRGLDLSLRYQPKSWLYLSGDVNYTHARSLNTAEDASFIPLAPPLTVMGRIQMIHPSGWFGGLLCRHMADRAANEDNSIIARGYTIFDGNLGYTYKNVECGIKVRNLLNTKWNETQFATTSRLRDEQKAIEEIHFTPGTPFALQAYISYTF